MKYYLVTNEELGYVARINRPVDETRVFTNENEAIEESKQEIISEEYGEVFVYEITVNKAVSVTSTIATRTEVLEEYE